MIDGEDKYHIAEKQRRLFRMMKDFHQFCIQHNIKYSIIGGTLLGAIRENGFIPWDDDVDVLLDRDNFNKLSKSSDYLQDYYLKELLWVYKIIDKTTYDREGIQDNTPVLDIFIADRVPAGRLYKAVKLLGLKTLQGMMKMKTSNRKDISFVYKIALSVTSVLGKWISTCKKQEMYTALSMWGNKDNKQPLMICNDIFQSLGCEYEPTLMDEYIIENFEDAQFMAIKEWDNYLAEQYGDYMKPMRIEH